MTTFSYSNGTLNVDCEYNTGYVSPATTQLVQLIQALLSMVNVVPLDQFLFETEPDGIHLYRFRAVDGRIWRQKITFTAFGDEDPAMTFSVADPWKLSEFERHRPVREAIILLHNAFDVQRFVVNWT